MTGHHEARIVYSGSFDIMEVTTYGSVFGVYQGLRRVRVHPAAVCVGTWCAVHNPSPHHMRRMPQAWRDDIKLMERTCHHGVGHPDPDDLCHDAPHGCCPDRCCTP